MLIFFLVVVISEVNWFVLSRFGVFNSFNAFRKPRSKGGVAFFFYMQKCFACTYVYAAYACLVPMEARSNVEEGKCC